MIEKIYFESKGLVCELSANAKTIEKILKDDFTNHFIPDVTIAEKNNRIVDVYVSEGQIKNYANIHYPIAKIQKNLPERDIISLCEYLLERARQEKKGIYNLNSTTAYRDNNAVTFFAGATNSGKTSAMLELIKNHEFLFYSDEHTLIDLENKQIVGGSRSIATRKMILKEKTNSNKEFFAHSSDYSNKDAFLFIYPHIDHGLSQPITYQFSPMDFHWLLTKELGGIIRGAVKFVNNFHYPLPSIDTQKLSEQRVKNTLNFTSNVPCYYFQGSLNQMANFVMQQYNTSDKKDNEL